MRLDLERVSAGYGPFSVLRDVDLTVPGGRVVALLGPNGAGKTTLLNVISGLTPARSGRVFLDGDDVTAEPTQARAARGVCHLPEAGSVFAALTVGENLRMFSRDRRDGRDGRDGRDAIDRAVDAFPRLAGRLRQVAGSLSGGEQRMVALARAYVTNPALILADELSMGLAPNLVQEIMDFLGRLAQQGTGLLLVEQYVSKALAMADIVYVLSRGRVTFAGEPVELVGDDLSARYFADA